MTSQDDIQTTTSGQAPSESGGFWSGVAGVASGIFRTAGRAVQGIGYVVTHPINSIKEVGRFGGYVASNPGEAGTLLGQGAINGVASIIGITGALGKVGFNLLTFPARSVVNSGAKLLGAEDNIWNKITYDCTGGMQALADRTGWVQGIVRDQGRALDGYQKTILFGSQALIEVPAFVAATALTGGVAGGVMAAARGGSVIARAGETARKAASWANPLHGTWNRAIEATGVAWSMDATWQHYDSQVEDRANFLGELMIRSEFGDSAASQTPTDPYASLPTAISADSISNSFNNAPESRNTDDPERSAAIDPAATNLTKEPQNV